MVPEWASYLGNSCCSMLTSKNDVSGLLGNSRYPVDRPIPESWCRSHSHALVCGPVQLKRADHIESTGPSRMSPFIHLPNPLGWESVWIAEELFEKVDIGVVTVKSAYWESILNICVKLRCSTNAYKPSYVAESPYSTIPRKWFRKIYCPRKKHGQWVKHVTKRTVVWF